MGQFHDSMGAAVESLQAAFGEDGVIYAPASGPQAELTGVIIDRGQLAPVPELGGQVGAVHAVLTIPRSQIARISRGDGFIFADTEGGEATSHHDVQIDRERTDSSFWVLNVR